MSKPESESLLKPVTNTENNVTEIHKKESEGNSSTGIDVSRSLIDGETDKLPPLAEPENYTDDTDKRLHILINDEFLEHEGEHDEVDLSDRAGFPYAPGFEPHLHNTISTGLESLPDLNIYQQKKTVAQGMMDLALFSANANQLRYVLESGKHAYYYPGLVLISLSLLFQVAVGVGLLWNTMYNVKDEKEVCIANKVNNFTVVGIFLVTVINVFICAFGTTAGTSTV